MEQKNKYKDLIKWGSENDENRKQAIQWACSIIAVLNANKGKNLSDKDLEKLAGGCADFFGTFPTDMQKKIFKAVY